VYRDILYVLDREHVYRPLAARVALIAGFRRPVRPGAGRAEKRADGASADQALYAPFTTCNGQRTVAGSNRRRPLDPRKACGSGRLIVGRSNAGES